MNLSIYSRRTIQCSGHVTQKLHRKERNSFAKCQRNTSSTQSFDYTLPRSTIHTNFGSTTAKQLMIWKNSWPTWSACELTTFFDFEIQYTALVGHRDLLKIYIFCFRIFSTAYNQLDADEFIVIERFVRKGQICAAFYMKKWHRAEIVDVYPKEEQVKVNRASSLP